MNALFSSVISAAVLTVMVSSGAEAMPRLNTPQSSTPHRQASRMLELTPQPTPIGYVMFCMNYSAQCKRVASGKRLALTDRTWSLITAVNRDVNQRIAPDSQKGTVDWSLTTMLGNCNDYAVQKRDELIRRGIPASALSLSVVVTPRSEGHLILTVRTDHGDYVLDNLRSSIVAWDETGYRWVSVQSGNNPNQWVKVASQS